MSEIDEGGFQGKGEVFEYAKLNNQLFSESAKLAEIKRQWRSDTPWSQWSQKDWDEAHTDVATALGTMGASGAVGRARLSEWRPPKAALDKFPEHWGNGIPNRDGAGFRWLDPNDKGSGVRIDQGNPYNSQTIQQVDHVVVRSNGRVIGRDGRPITGSIKANPEQAHIPLSEYVKWKTWNSPN